MGHYCGGGQGHKAREMNADGGRAVSLCPGSPCPGLSSKTESAGLSACRQQKERPFLDMVSMSVLSLCTKSEFGAGSALSSGLNRMRWGDQAAFFPGCALATGCNSLSFVSRVGNPRVLSMLAMPFMLCQFSPRMEGRAEKISIR